MKLNQSTLETEFNVHVSNQLIAGYKALHECGLLLNNLPRSHGNSTEAAAETYCRLIFTHIGEFNPSKQSTASKLLDLCFDLNLNHQFLIDLLLVCLSIPSFCLLFDFRAEFIAFKDESLIVGGESSTQFGASVANLTARRTNGALFYQQFASQVSPSITLPLIDFDLGIYSIGTNNNRFTSI